MSKTAFIITTPHAPKQDPLPGAQRDADDWHAFLLSPEGGAWNEDEIQMHVDNQPMLIKLALSVASTRQLDYALLAFCGHGRSISQSGTTELYLDETHSLHDYGLTVKARRELVIIDACREYAGDIPQKELLKRAMLNCSAALEDEDRRQKARELFERDLVRTPEGRTLVFSCEAGQTAADVPSSFTQYLISDAKGLAGNDRLVRTISIKEAFDVAEGKPAQINYPQKPVYNGQRRSTHIPFAVSI
jgi:hypothetical protein